jgi:hypothetical protein
MPVVPVLVEPMLLLVLREEVVYIGFLVVERLRRRERIPPLFVVPVVVLDLESNILLEYCMDYLVSL